MSSLIRCQQRKLARTAGTYVVKPRAFVVHDDGGYSVLRPTKGWLRVSAARLRAQGRLAEINERIRLSAG